MNPGDALAILETWSGKGGPLWFRVMMRFEGGPGATGSDFRSQGLELRD